MDALDFVEYLHPNSDVSSMTIASSDDSVRSERSVLAQRPDISNYYCTPCPVLKFSRRGWSAIPHKDYLSTVESHILRKIFACLNKRDLTNVMATCRHFHAIGQDPSFWEFLNLQNKHLSESAIHSLLDRRLKVLNASITAVYRNDIFVWYDFSAPLRPAALTHLDLSQARFTDSRLLATLLERCARLQALSLEQCYTVDDTVCTAISRNARLEILNLIMAKTVTASGLTTIFSKCKLLQELNIGWIGFTAELIAAISQFLPVSLKRLNMSGIDDLPEMTDDVVRAICQRCVGLEELDLSDCSTITETSVDHFCKFLPRLFVLSLSRCYGIEPTSFLRLTNLYTLNIFGCITDEGAEFLRTRLRLRPTEINDSPFSTVARPTVGESVTSVWGRRTRDWY